MLPAGMPNQKDSHTWAKKGGLHQAGAAARQGALPMLWSGMLPALCWRRGKMDFADSFGKVKADFWAWAEQTWKRNFSSQPRVASSEKVAWANLLCADSVFSTELNPSSPCEEFAFGDHLLYGSCLLSSGWGKPLVYMSSLRWKVCWLEEFFFMFEKI